MMPGYHLILRAHAHKHAVLDRTVDIPDFKTAIGAGERLDPHPVTVRLSDAVRPVRAKIEDVRTVDDVTIDGQGPLFSEFEFPRTGWIGSFYGGV